MTRGATRLYLMLALAGLSAAGCAAPSPPSVASAAVAVAAPSTPPADVAPTAPSRVPPAVSAPYQGSLPPYATKDARTEEVYRWAAPNRAILQYFQCTCGCELEAGHTSTWNCYVQEAKPGGEYVWDSGTDGHSGSWLELGNDGLLRVIGFRAPGGKNKTYWLR